VALTVELLERLIAAQPPTDDTGAALNLLRRSDLTQVAPAGDRTRYSPAEEWLQIYKIRQESALKAGITTYGFPSLLPALEKLHPKAPLTIIAFKDDEWLGIFWSDQADRLIGFVLVKHRTPQQEQERLDWFARHTT
jgi:hypothetical protein